MDSSSSCYILALILGYIQAIFIKFSRIRYAAEGLSHYFSPPNSPHSTGKMSQNYTTPKSTIPHVSNNTIVHSPHACPHQQRGYFCSDNQLSLLSLMKSANIIIRPVDPMSDPISGTLVYPSLYAEQQYICIGTRISMKELSRDLWS